MTLIVILEAVHNFISHNLKFCFKEYSLFARLKAKGWNITLFGEALLKALAISERASSLQTRMTSSRVQDALEHCDRAVLAASSKRPS